MRYDIEPLANGDFVLTWYVGNREVGSLWLTLEEAKAIHSDLEKHLMDVWVEQHGMD